MRIDQAACLTVYNRLKHLPYSTIAATVLSADFQITISFCDDGDVLLFGGKYSYADPEFETKLSDAVVRLASDMICHGR